MRKPAPGPRGPSCRLGERREPQGLRPARRPRRDPRARTRRAGASWRTRDRGSRARDRRPRGARRPGRGSSRPASTPSRVGAPDRHNAYGPAPVAQELPGPGPRRHPDWGWVPLVWTRSGRVLRPDPDSSRRGTIGSVGEGRLRSSRRLSRYGVRSRRGGHDPYTQFPKGPYVDGEVPTPDRSRRTQPVVERLRSRGCGEGPHLLGRLVTERHKTEGVVGPARRRTQDSNRGTLRLRPWSP